MGDSSQASVNDETDIEAAVSEDSESNGETPLPPSLQSILKPHLRRLVEITPPPPPPPPPPASALPPQSLQMLKIAMRGTWDEAKGWFNEDAERAKARISSRWERPLHVAVGTGKANEFVRELLDFIRGRNDEVVVLELTDCFGETALHYAARIGNKEAVVMLVDRRPELMYMKNKLDRLPVQIAAIHGQKEILTYLIEKSVGDNHDVDKSPFVGDLGVRLLIAVIASGFFDVALYLVDKYPDLAQQKTCRGSNSLVFGKNDTDSNYTGSSIRTESSFEVQASALRTLAGMTRAFPNGESCSFWHNFIYSCIIPLESSSWKCTITGDNAPNGCRRSSCFSIRELLQKVVTSKVVQDLVPHVERIGREKLMHQQALKLVKVICQKIGALTSDKASAMFRECIILAAKNGIHQVVREIVEISPTSVFERDPKTGRDIFCIAAKERHENVFNLLYDMSDRKFNFYGSADSKENNCMHLCAEIAPSHKLDLVPGPALQMQRELQWFKEAEKFIHPSRGDWENRDGYTPKKLFSLKHGELKKRGEEWMRSTANSCSVAAALVATVMFAAVFTVPGGVNSKSGIPTFHDIFPYMIYIFIISDAVSLFTSLTSLLMFLSILTSRYAEEDFLHVLPKRLSIGLLALFTAITFMMATFGAALYIMLVEKNAWLLIPVAALACLPITSFVLLQFPLLLAVVSSTYGPSIFGKKTGEILY